MYSNAEICLWITILVHLFTFIMLGIQTLEIGTFHTFSLVRQEFFFMFLQFSQNPIQRFILQNQANHFISDNNL